MRTKITRIKENLVRLDQPVVHMPERHDLICMIIQDISYIEARLERLSRASRELDQELRTFYKE